MPLPILKLLLSEKAITLSEMGTADAATNSIAGISK